MTTKDENLTFEPFNEARIKIVLNGFDPLNNEPDRHILYEVVGERKNPEQDLQIRNIDESVEAI